MTNPNYYDSGWTYSNPILELEEEFEWKAYLKKLKQERKLMNKQTAPCRPTRRQRVRKNQIKYYQIHQYSSQRAN